VLGQAGQLDPAFGKAGVFVSALSSLTVPLAAALQSDGKILVAGQFNGEPGVMRLNTNGTLDTSFGTTGVVITTVGGNADGGTAIGVAVQSTGKIVLGISTESICACGFILARFNSNGSPDTSFGTGGSVTVVPFDMPSSAPSVMALQPDGKILLASDGIIGHFIASGQTDTAFGSGGFAFLPFISVTAIALQPNGGILAGTGGLLQGSFPSTGALTTGAIARFTPSGVLDTSFGISSEAASLASIAAIGVQSDGQPLVAGTIVSQAGIPAQTGFGLVRFNTNGSIDTSFGLEGGVITPIPGSFADAFAIAIQTHGAIVTAGRAGSKTGFNVPSSLALARYLTGGNLDTSFGSGGTKTTSLGATSLAYANSLLILTDGKLVVAGNTGKGTNGVSNVVVVRYLGQ
jgi:uncharacterized delta-60 repeat protein